MRPIRTVAPLALGLVALAAAGCQRPSHPTTTAAPTPTRVERAAPTTTPTRQATPPASPAPKPGPETVVGLWPVKTLAQARALQDSVDAGHQPWLLSAESVSLAYAKAELGLFAPYAQRVGPSAYQVRSHHGEWEATCTWRSPSGTTTASGS